MRDLEHSLVEINTAPFDALIGEDIIKLIFDNAPTKIANRIGKALEHFTKAGKLQGVDDEMGVIRLIAAEEELVVAIFEWLKLNVKTLPAHGDFIGKYKNHYVKLAFHPVLSQLRFVLGDIMETGITFEGLEETPPWHVKAMRLEGRVVLQISNSENELIMNFNPLDLAITRDERPANEVTDELYVDLKMTVSDQHGMTLRQFVTARADFRNKLLYSEDGATFSLGQSLKQLTEDVFSHSLRDLLWCIAALLTNKPTARSWGLVSQFIDLYRKVLRETKLI